ncbi:MAG: hypothetical protein KatS3mg076_1546 [Candidatus Binatia bacterium]|nr:MAG: hypothetical protein KatS3mg076_1546 [Candidatus Binatia bacterium]
MRRRVVLGILLASLVVAATSWAQDWSRRLAERGPATLVVGAVFTVASPPAILWGAVRGRPVRLAACRLGHGLKMLAASVVVLPAGLLVSPFHYRRLPSAWMDALVDSMQEDYCSRPLTSVLP